MCKMTAAVGLNCRLIVVFKMTAAVGLNCRPYKGILIIMVINYYPLSKVIES